MKYITILLLALSSFTACDKKAKESEEITSSESESETENIAKVFVKDAEKETTIECKISTQYFGSNKDTDNFSVLCQQDDPLHLLQITFANEAEARSGKELKYKGSSYKVETGGFSIEYSDPTSKQFKATSESNGSFKIIDNKLIISDFKLYNQDNQERVVGAELNF